MNRNRFALIFTCSLLASGIASAAYSQTFKPAQTVKPPDSDPTKPVNPATKFPTHPTSLRDRFYLPPMVNKSTFPAYDKDSYAKMRMKQTRAKTVWSAPTKAEQSMLQSVSESQLQQGVEDPNTLMLSWRAASYFCKIQKYNQAEPLLKELVATIESHPQTPQSKVILSEAKKKLVEIDEARAKNRMPGVMPPYQIPSTTPRRGVRNWSPPPSSSLSPAPSPVPTPITVPPNVRRIPGTDWEIQSKSDIDYKNINGN